MKLKHLATSLNATFESFVTRIENHEAVAASMIQDISQAAARLRVQSNRVQSQVATFERSRQTLQTQADCWQTRAQTRSLSNPAQALQCLQRRDATRTRLERVTRELTESTELQNQLALNLQQIEQRLSELRTRRTALASREACVGAIARSHPDESCNDIDALFDRWEEVVLATQYNQGGHGQLTATSWAGPADSTSGFARELEREEYEDRLAKELAQLQDQQTKKSQPNSPQ